MGVGGLGARAGAAGGAPATRGLGFKARELGIILGTPAASRLCEQQGGAPVCALCPGEVTRRSGGGPLGGLGWVTPVGCSVSSSVRWTQPWGLWPLREHALGGGLAEGQPGRGSSEGLQVTVPLAPAETCEADCMRKRAEQSLQAAIKTLRKSIGRQQFSIQIAGTEYAMAQWPAKALEGQGACSTGQVLQDGKCGASLPVATGMPTGQTPSALPSTGGLGKQTPREGTGRHRGLPQSPVVRITMAVV